MNECYSMPGSLRINLLGKKAVESGPLEILEIHRLVTHCLPAAYVDIRVALVRHLNHFRNKRVLIYFIAPLDGAYLLVECPIDDLCPSTRLHVLRVHIRGKR